MVRKTKEEAQETRENILDAATKIFDERGIMQTSLEDIAVAAGVTRGAVYWHFKNKVDIFAALHERKHTSFMQIMADSLAATGTNPLGQLCETVIRLFEDLTEDNLQTCRIFALRCEYSGDFEPFLESYNKGDDDVLAMIVQFFEKASRQGALYEGADPKILATAFFCLINGIFNKYLRSSRMDIRDMTRPMIEVFFCNIQARD